MWNPSSSVKNGRLHRNIISVISASGFHSFKVLFNSCHHCTFVARWLNVKFILTATVRVTYTAENGYLCLRPGFCCVVCLPVTVRKVMVLRFNKKAPVKHLSWKLGCFIGFDKRGSACDIIGRKFVHISVYVQSCLFCLSRGWHSNSCYNVNDVLACPLFLLWSCGLYLQCQDCPVSIAQFKW